MPTLLRCLRRALIRVYAFAAMLSGACWLTHAAAIFICEAGALLFSHALKAIAMITIRHALMPVPRAMKGDIRLPPRQAQAQVVWCAAWQAVVVEVGVV